MAILYITCVSSFLVCTLLGGTRPVSCKFRLKNWTKRQIDKHGMKGFNDNKLRILNEGKAFHAVSITTVHVVVSLLNQLN